MKTRFVAPLLLALAMTGCATQKQAGLPLDTVSQAASAGPLSITEAQVITDNDAAFLSSSAWSGARSAPST